MTKAVLPSGVYPIEQRIGEIERLRLQNEAWGPYTETLLTRIGVEQGWHCLDLACGPGGITDVLARKVGATGRVVGLDGNASFLDEARSWGPKTVEYMEGDAYATGLPDAHFDLVHIRFLASTAGNPQGLIREGLRLLKTGGTLAFQEASFDTLNCYPPHPAWKKMLDIFHACFPGHDGEPVAYQLYRMLRGAGCDNVGYNPCIVGVKAGDPWHDYFPATVDSLRSIIARKNLINESELDQTLADCRTHLAHHDTIFTSITCVQVWGEKA